MDKGWIAVVSVDEVPEDDVLGVKVQGQPIALYKIDGEIYATHNICTHGQALLSDGFVENGEIECPLHQGRFCIKTGKAKSAPLSKDIKVYATALRDGQVYINLD